MKNKKQLKNNLFFILILLLFSFVVFLSANFLNNELNFKLTNSKGINTTSDTKKTNLFSKSKEIYPNWSVISEINNMDLLYKNKKYNELIKKLPLIEKKYCTIKTHEVYDFCENIFYLNGLVNYQLGEQKENNKIKEQKDLFYKSINNFKDSLLINKNNTWAKENIEFILNKLKNLDNNKSKKKDKEENQKDKKNKDNQENKNEDKKNEKKRDKKKDDKNKNEDQKNNKNKNNEKKQNSNENKTTKSRLPKEIKRKLEEHQKQLEKNQQNQQGFARSKEKAKKNKEDSENPFNDPFFQNFFSNDPFMQNNLRKTLPNQNEKDW